LKTLFTSVPAYGHFNPLVPLAIALKRQGHTVSVATAPHFGPAVQAVGLEHIPAGLDKRLGEVQAAALRRLKPDQHPFAGIFLDALAGPMLSDLLAIVPRWGADVIVHESHELGGPTAAEMLGLPHVAVGINWIPYESKRLDVLMGPDYADFRATHGLPPDPTYGQIFRYLYLHPFPPSMAPVPDPVVHITRLLRPDLPEPPAAYSTPELPVSPERKTVYASLGTVFHEIGGQPNPLFDAIISALQNEPITLLITTGGDVELRIPGSSRAVVAIERYIPLAAVLPRCDLVIAHGGLGTMLGALRYGLPQLNLPIAADQGWNAEHLAELGAGMMLNWDQAGVDEIRSAVQELLGKKSYRERAQELQADLDAMPSPEEVAETIVQLAGK
jgi:UDP:flavonoid glycosyltransferase YjiC (YdhE family)